ncbi:hypothetical protein Scep_000580 [Stephania cephalantha]|uniref:Uncharacterized protein n=1 Tax=Stephania cephalantha TaxID=152367 RepID=A0AAP0LAI1_9MAGN
MAGFSLSGGGGGGGGGGEQNNPANEIGPESLLLEVEVEVEEEEGGVAGGGVVRIVGIRRRRIACTCGVERAARAAGFTAPLTLRAPGQRDSGAGTATSNALASTRLPNPTSGLELANFPPELNSPATFRCVRVSSMYDADDQYAYQTAVNIGGHVFKGILYDQGLDQHSHRGEGSSGGGGGGGGVSRNLIAGGSSSSGGGGGSTTAAMLDPSSIYPTPLNAFMAGTQFFPHPRS